MSNGRTYPLPPALLTLDEAATFLRTPVAALRYRRHLGIVAVRFRLGRRAVTVIRPSTS